jgi:hypothetical protein
MCLACASFLLYPNKDAGLYVAYFWFMRIDILFHDFAISPTTWVHLASLLIIALFFKFNRIWSLRNIDLLAIILLAPGLVLLDYGQNKHQQTSEMVGYVWLFVVTGVLLVRMLLDPMMVRRPLLEPNLSLGGMIFLTVCLFVFLMVKVVNVKPSNENLMASGPVPATRLKPPLEDQPPKQIQPLPPLSTQFEQQDKRLDEEPETGSSETKPELPTPIITKPQSAASIPFERSEATQKASEPAAASRPSDIADQQPLTDEERLSRLGPGYWLVRALPVLATPIHRDDDQQPKFTAQEKENARNRFISLTILVLAHLSVVLGLVANGYRHFGNLSAGVAAGLLYLLLPYTAIYVGWVTHVLPAAFLTWAVYFYRRPLIAGMFIGLACGTVYYPVFLLTLWISFYWQRGLWRFLSGYASLIGLLIVVTAFYAENLTDFIDKFRSMSGFIFPTDSPRGFWGLLDENYRVYRITVLAAHIALCGSFALWPARKNLGTLLSCSTAVMLSTQFWAAIDGGTSIGWYLPLLLLTIFRPNLEDRVALSVLPESGLGMRRLRVSKISQAA